MWIFTSEGLLSICDRDGGTDYLTVRARKPSLLEKLTGRRATFTPASDYAYRVRISRSDLERVIMRLIARCDYPNFKNTITDPAYHNACERVWWEMASLQNPRPFSGVTTAPTRRFKPATKRKITLPQKPILPLNLGCDFDRNGELE